MNFKLREYQKQAVNQVNSILSSRKLCILNGEVRTGKTHIALQAGKNYKRVLFITTKKAISSIQSDYNDAKHAFEMVLINYESLHKVQGKFDLVIVDESHKISAYPKPAKRTKLVKQFCSNDVLIMTGTLIPESNSQIFHQLWISKFTPFNRFKNFYAWFKTYGTPEIIYTAYGQSTSYKNSKWEMMKEDVDSIRVIVTQQAAGFECKITNHFHNVKMNKHTDLMIKKLIKDRVIQGKEDVILADTPAKLQQKVHQLSSGTIKLESGKKIIFDYSKAEFIAEKFKGKKKAIFYKFTAELEAIKKHLDITQDIEEFNNSKKDIALQIVSGREGTNLSAADCLIMYNIDFSAVSYWQARDRMTVLKRKENNVFIRTPIIILNYYLPKFNIKHHLSSSSATLFTFLIWLGFSSIKSFKSIALRSFTFFTFGNNSGLLLFMTKSTIRIFVFIFIFTRTFLCKYHFRCIAFQFFLRQCFTHQAFYLFKCNHLSR